MSFDPREYRPESNKADCGHLFAGTRLQCACGLEFCASECKDEHHGVCDATRHEVDCPYDHEPACTCERIDVDLYDASGCELDNVNSRWNVERRAWDRAHEPQKPDTRPFVDGPIVEMECPF